MCEQLREPSQKPDAGRCVDSNFQKNYFIIHKIFIASTSRAKGRDGVRRLLNRRIFSHFRPRLSAENRIETVELVAHRLILTLNGLWTLKNAIKASCCPTLRQDSFCVIDSLGLRATGPDIESTDARRYQVFQRKVGNPINCSITQLLRSAVVNAREAVRSTLKKPSSFVVKNFILISQISIKFISLEFMLQINWTR